MDFRYARAPAPASSDSHLQPSQPPVPPPPGTSYSGQFQYHSPSPHPPQWAPQSHSEHHHPLHPSPYAAAPPPPMPYPSNHYSIPPRHHMPPPPPPPPPQHPHYPPVNQDWNNPSWGHQGWGYSAHNQNEEDLAARARAYAASKALADDQHQHAQSAPANPPEDVNHQNQYSQNLDFQQPSVPPSSYQQYSYPANHSQEPSSFSYGYAPDGHYSYPHQETAPVHQQEVPSSYSSVAGNEDPSDTNRNFYQPSHMAFASAPQHQVQQINERSMSVEQPHYSFNNSSVESEPDLSNQPLDFGPRYGHDHDPFGQSGVPGMPYSSIPAVHTTIQQADLSVGVSSPVSMHSTPLFGRISSFQLTMPSNAFHGDMYGTPGNPERPKKASVPSWLREEIIKKKAVIGSSASEVSRQDTELNEDEVMDHKEEQLVGKNMDSTRLTEEEEGDDEEDVEAARTAAVNQEIKRILTEVLLKVTDELFDEIATNVLEEDDLDVEVERKSDNTSAAATAVKSTAKVIIPAKTKVSDADDVTQKSDSNSPGDVLGLGSYASDDDDDEGKEVQNPSSNSSNPPVHLEQNGTSHTDNNDTRMKRSDSRDTGPSEAIESHIDKSGEEKVKPDSFDSSKSKQQSVKKEDHTEVVENKAKKSLHDDSQGRSSRNGPDKTHNKVVESNRADNEGDIKRVKKEDESGNKEKIKGQDSGKRVGKGEGNNDKEERERDKRARDKEDNRKREKEKDDKNERSKYKPVGESSRHKRYYSPSPGGRGRSSKDNNSSVNRAHGSGDSSSDDSRRKVRSKRRDSSPSPVRSRRQVSRSPSKRSHRRHSIYSSIETTRERRRSRSRSRSRR